MQGVPRIHCDFESRSLIDIKLGADVYARHYSTSPIMLSLVAPHAGVEYVHDFLQGVEGYQSTIYPFAQPGDPLFRAIKPPCPPIILQAIAEGWIFVAHNARFEQTIWYHICTKLWGWPFPLKWSCTAARSRYMGIRASLEGAGSDLEIVNQKYDGKEFINNFCKPRKYKGAKKLGIIKELWYEPQDNPEGWDKGLHYCLQDSYAEADIDALLPELPPFEQAIWELDFKINVRGLPIDVQSVRRAIQFSDHFTAANYRRFDELTALRPTQRDKVLEYINQREEIANSLGDLKSKTLKRLVRADMPSDLQEIIDIRLEASGASIKKLERMRDCTDDDGRARGLLLYYGAHTGRWTSKRIQKQNMKRPDPKAPAKYMFDFLQGPWWDIPQDEMPQQPAWVREAGIRFIKPLSYLGTSMRGFIQAAKGHKLVVGDYAQIEARVLAWLARELWLLDAFRNRDDVYTRFAATNMYPGEMGSYEQAIIIKNGKAEVKPEFKSHRQKAKSAQLGCGFQVGPDAFVEYCDNIDLIITRDEAKEIVTKYRGAHPAIVAFWTRIEHAAILATGNEGERVGLAGTDITFHVHRLDQERWWLINTLPSGRHIAYYRPKLRLVERWGRTREVLSFRTEWNGKSFREDTYGGKLTENDVQGTARDVCAQGALNAEAAGFPLIGLVHDELISMPPLDFHGHDVLCQEMCRLPAWITDLPVEADGSTMDRYGK